MEENNSVYRYDWHEHAEVPSTERATCERCGVEGWRGDHADQGGIVADVYGDLACDDCVDERGATLPDGD